MGAISRRLQALLDERDQLELARLAIAQGLTIPETAKQFVTTKEGVEGQAYHGDQIRLWIDERLKVIREELKDLPFVMTVPVANRMNVLGKDFSQVKPTT